MMGHRNAWTQFALTGEAPPSKRTNRRVEQGLVKAAITYARHHPKVKHAWRANSGNFPVERDGRRYYYRCNFNGCSDVLGLMVDGRVLALEGKQPGEVPSADQQWWLDTVAECNGVHGVFESLDDVRRILEAA